MSKKTPSAEKQLMDLHRRYARGTISRRDFMRQAAALGMTGLSAPALIEALTVSAAAAADNPTVIENQQAGSSGWQIALNPADDATGQIKGYASATSVNKGQPITFYVSVNPAQSFSLDVYRIGWYQGSGGRLLQHIGPFNAVQQPPPAINSTTGLAACNWAASYTLSVPTTWTSGVYLALLTNSQNYQSYIIFVVRDDNRIAPLLYQQSVTTYQAYNNYPDDGKTGKSLYEYNSYGANTVSDTTRAVKVSFDRPYTSSTNSGAGHFLLWELYFVRWLERSGYDVTYTTDLDTHANGSRLLNYKGFLSMAHDEYWSKEMRDAAEAARDAGVNLAFFGADAVYWQVRFEASATGVANRVMVCYKDAAKDPVQGATTTTLWRQAPVNRPEQLLMGVQFTSQTQNNAYIPYVVTNSSHWVYAQTGFRDGDSVPGIVGYEADRQFPQQLPAYIAGSYTLLSQSPYNSAGGWSDWSNSSIYQAASGAWVFAAGTIAWSWALDNYGVRNIADSRIQQTTANILNQFVGTGGTRDLAAPSNLTATAASAETVNLGWINNSTTAESLVIERCTAQLSWTIFTSSLPANSTSYTDIVTGADVVYYYRVKATNTAGSTSSYSNTAMADMQLLPPQGLSAASPTGYQVDLSWADGAASEKAYTVERSPNGSTNWTVLTSALPENATSYSDTSANPVTTYYYRVKATNGTNSSSYSIVSITTQNDVPRAPSNLTATRNGTPRNQIISLSWIDNSNNETGFVIERSTAADFTRNLLVINLPSNTTRSNDDTVQRSTTYYYRVQAANTNVRNSAYSNVASERTK